MILMWFYTEAQVTLMIHNESVSAIFTFNEVGNIKSVSSNDYAVLTLDDEVVPCAMEVQCSRVAVCT